MGIADASILPWRAAPLYYRIAASLLLAAPPPEPREDCKDTILLSAGGIEVKTLVWIVRLPSPCSEGRGLCV